MCGIAGIFQPQDSGPVSRQVLESMITVMSYRGPDEQGIFTDSGIGLAHVRLSIIDLDTGQQPVTNEDDTVYVVFNGEIFNYIELRQSLIGQGHQFRTLSDTEVIVHLYEQYGLSFVDHLNGQFAIALWDVKRRRLVLARDRTGIRPLLYTQIGDQLLFASEAKALFAHPAVNPRLNTRALADTLMFWGPINGRTAFEDIRSLEPGHLLVADASGVQKSCYWDWDFEPGDIEHRADQQEELASLLEESVSLRMRADVPVAAYLSGGLDSAAVTALILGQKQAPLQTFSLTFDDPEFDESDYQRELVKYLGTQHTSIACSKGDIAAALPRTIWHTEAPIVRTAPVPLMLLSKAVKDAGFKVVVTGEGADEVFAGYDLFKEARIRRFIDRQPDSRWRPGLLARLYPWLTTSPTGLGSYSNAFFSRGREFSDRPWYGHLPRWQTGQRNWRFFSADIRDSLAAGDAYSEIEASAPDGIDEWDPLARDQYFEAHTLLAGYLLSAQGDRVAMANSVETRYPFLDHRLIEFAARLPANSKLQGLQEKFILKKTMQGRLPQRIIERHKQPYRSPDSSSFFDSGQPPDYVGELLSPARIQDVGIFDAASVSRLFNKCRRGDAKGFGDNMAFVGILTTMLLDDMYIRGNAGAVQGKGI